MTYKIAVASDDGKTVNQHFGRGKEFYIFEVDDDGAYSLKEIRKKADDSEGVVVHGERILKIAELLVDCSKVLVSQIGLGAEQILNVKGIRAYTVNGAIENALSKLINYENKRKGFKRY